LDNTQFLLDRKLIVYCDNADGLQFCSYEISRSIWKKSIFYYLTYTEGIIGDFNDWECQITKDLKEIELFELKKLEKYPEKFEPIQKIEIQTKISIQGHKDYNKIKNELDRLIQFVFFNCGIGIDSLLNSHVTIKNELLFYRAEFLIVQYTDLSGILRELSTKYDCEFTINKMN
jgi:hypothetical protein